MNVLMLKMTVALVKQLLFMFSLHDIF